MRACNISKEQVKHLTLTMMFGGFYKKWFKDNKIPMPECHWMGHRGGGCSENPNSSKSEEGVDDGQKDRNGLDYYINCYTSTTYSI
jgi:hypothetical protein